METKKYVQVTGIFFLSALLVGVPSLAHQGHSHPSRGAAKESKEVVPEKLIQSYRTRVEPIIQNKCLQCHGGTPIYPWYYKLPGIKQLIDKDIEESKHHLDLSKGYPFVSHASTLEDLLAIKESIGNKTMPPFIYLLGHGAHHLTEEERKIVIQWTDEGISILKESAGAKK